MSKAVVLGGEISQKMLILKSYKKILAECSFLVYNMPVVKPNKNISR